MGIEDNTIFIIAADNGTSGYGKGKVEKQRGQHIPFIVYAPGLKMQKQGEQDILVNVADVLPTVADIVGYKIPKNYKVDGVSLLPYLTTNKTEHRDFIYTYRSGMQLIRGSKVLKDGYGDWYDVSTCPDDYNSFAEIKDWSKVSAAHRAEHEKLMKILPKYDLYKTERNGPGGTSVPEGKALRIPVKTKAKTAKSTKFTKSSNLLPLP